MKKKTKKQQAEALYLREAITIDDFFDRLIELDYSEKPKLKRAASQK